ncbi:MAG: hypothetical protein O2840_04370 [bacterium]|nr:hypothetical protein [bacterium]
MLKQHIFTLVLILLGLFLRSYEFGYYPLGFDAIQILTQAEKIAAGDVIAIGPPTGPANIFIGPLIYYIAAPILLFTSSPYALVVVTVTLALFTGLTIWFFCTKLFDRFITISIVSLWAFSPLLVSLDRLPWNANLSVLAASCSFFPLLLLAKKQHEKRTSNLVVISLFVGSFLGYQAHFSGLLQPAIVVFSLLLLRSKNIWYYSAAIGGVIASLLPTVVFDWRHDFQNYYGFLELLRSQTDTTSNAFSVTLYHTLRISVENIGKIIFDRTNYYLTILAGLGTLVFALVRAGSRSILLSVVWFGLVAAAFALYKEDTPEYYYLIQFPAFFYLISLTINRVLTKSWQCVLFPLVFFIYSFFILFPKQKPLALEIANQLSLVETIQEMAHEQQVSEIVFDMKYYDALGLQHLLARTDVPFVESGKKLHIIYPYSDNAVMTTQFERAALWLDPRTNSNNNFVSEEQYLIETSPELFLYEDSYKKQQTGDTTYSFFLDGRQTNEQLLVFVRSDENRPKYEPLYLQLPNAPSIVNGWKLVTFSGAQLYTQQVRSSVFLYIPGDSDSSPSARLANIVVW